MFASHARRALLGCCLLLLVAGTGTATALTVAPSGTYAMASGTLTMRSTMTGQQVTCSSSSWGASIAADGTGSMANGNLTMTNCSNALLGAYTVIQTAAWPVAVTAPGGTSTAISWTVPAGGMRVALTGCTFTLSGVLTVTAPTLTVGFSTALTATTRPPQLTVDSSSGSTCLFFPLGDTVTLSYTLNINRAMTVTP